MHSSYLPAMSQRIEKTLNEYYVCMLLFIFPLLSVGVSLFNKVRSSEIRKSLNIDPLLLRIERSQLSWFGHVSRMPQERLPKRALLAKANGRDHSDDLELDGPITLRILDGIAWDFAQVK